MKILLVNTSDLRGGAAIASYRLMNALNESGVSAKMLVEEKISKNNNVIQIGSSLQQKWGFYSERANIFARNRFSRENLFDVSIANTGVSITNNPYYKEADVIHLNWINQGMLSINEIGKILSSGKKVVWTMHDMWPFTGICHHAGTCERYTGSCGMCPYLSSPSKGDISHSTFLRKLKAYSKGHITFVACSKWLEKLAASSTITNSHSLISIPNPIDTKMYHPMSKYSIRKDLNLPSDMKIVLFAAAKVSDRRKGIDYLIEAANVLSKREKGNMLFLVVGNDGAKISSQLPYSSYNIGYVDSEKMMNMYNVSDLFVTPSLQDNLPNTIMESMACGTPCVGFNIGGIPEMIQHKSTGYVANYKDAEDLATGISWVLNEADAETLSSNSREFVIRNYSQEEIVKRYIELYK